MQYYYSATTNAFYVDFVHMNAQVPDDLVPISQEDWSAIVSAGAGWAPGADGMPVANEPPEMPEPPPLDPPLSTYGAPTTSTVLFRERWPVPVLPGPRVEPAQPPQTVEGSLPPPEAVNDAHADAEPAP